ncbi:MAG: N-acetylmuramoyl-L-alanine amidase [Bacteroidales bacterium]|nr:N-acetylmuramoyl-L-alanine amidase [Bacteroidales bacterium]
MRNTFVIKAKMVECARQLIVVTSFMVLGAVVVFAQENHTSAQGGLSKIVLDAGHGGKDPGALGKKAKEKDIVLDVALRLGRLLNDSLPMLNITYTRDSDVFIPLNKRAEIANKAKADLFISIHANSSKSKDVYGAETFVLGLHRSKDNLEVAQKENSVIVLEDGYENVYEGFDPTQPESYIMFELMANAYLESSIVMASQIQESFVKAERGDRGVKQAGFLVLRQTSMPSVLVELGFMSNEKEEQYMMSDEGKEELTYSIYKALKQYKATYDAMNKVSTAQKKEEPVKEESAGIVYKIQIATTSKPLDKVGDKYGKVELKKEESKGKTVYKYFIGQEKKYSDIQKLQKKVKGEYSDCFIVAYENDKRVDLKYARKNERK